MSTESSPVVGNEIRGLCPADGHALSGVAVTPVQTLPAIVAAARAAQEVFAAKSIDDRVALLGRFKNALLAEGEAIAVAIVEECGKPAAEAWMVDVFPTADLAAYWCEEGPTHLAASEPDLDPISYPSKQARIERHARGVIALISPWNFPVAIPLRTIFPALLAGNAVVWKPSEFTPRCAAIVAKAATSVFGPDLVTVVQGAGEVGAALIAAEVDAVVFTGSVATGRKVAHAAADALIPASLELGGKDAAIVLDDAPLERTANGLLWGAMGNSGQNCASVERIYATPKIAGPLRDKLVELAKALEPGRDFGALCTPAQLATVERHVAAAVADGAVALTGGARMERAGTWYAPTILSNVNESSDVVVEETFGPVVPVIEVPDVETAIAKANASRYALTASIWTKDLIKGEALARKLRAGVVTVNNHSFTGAVPSLPWTGSGETGYGVTNSHFALDILTRPRTFLIDGSGAKRELWWYPYTPALITIAKSLSTLKGGAGIGAKLRAVFSLVGAFLKRWKL